LLLFRRLLARLGWWWLEAHLLDHIDVPLGADPERFCSQLWERDDGQADVEQDGDGNGDANAHLGLPVLHIGVQLGYVTQVDPDGFGPILFVLLPGRTLVEHMQLASCP